MDVSGWTLFRGFGCIVGIDFEALRGETGLAKKNVKITKNHNLSIAEARNRVDGIAESLSSTYGLSSAWDGDALKFNGNGVNGQIAVADKTIDVDVKLGFALAMMENTIRRSIETAIDKHLV
jgi:putative polyhydroxyalkanoate system protein